MRERERERASERAREREREREREGERDLEDAKQPQDRVTVGVEDHGRQAGHDEGEVHHVPPAAMHGSSIPPQRHHNAAESVSAVFAGARDGPGPPLLLRGRA